MDDNYRAEVRELLDAIDAVADALTDEHIAKRYAELMATVRRDGFEPPCPQDPLYRRAQSA